MIELIPVSKQDPYLRMLFYGEPNSGKTTMSTSGHNHPAFDKTLVINLDMGTKSIRHTTCLQTPNLTKSTDVEDVILSCKRGAGPYAGIKTLVLDSATELHRIILDEVVTARADKKGLQGIDRDKAEIQDYGSSGKRFIRICDMMRCLPCNVIWIALARSIRDKEDGPVTAIGPELPSKACGWLIAASDAVFPLIEEPAVEAIPAKQGVKEVKASEAHVSMAMRSCPPYYTRTRIAEFKVCDRIVTNPTLPQLWDIYAPKKAVKS